MNIEALRTGDEKSQALLRDFAADLRKAERRRQALVGVAIEEYDPNASDTDASAQFARDLRRADEEFEKASGRGVQRIMEALTEGLDVDTLVKDLGEALSEQMIIGFAVTGDGETEAMTADGPLPLEDVDKRIIRALVVLSRVPGMLPDVPGANEAMAKLEALLDDETAPIADASIEGIGSFDDLPVAEKSPNEERFEAYLREQGVRDFDGGVE